TTCNDGNACTQTDTCQTGVCSGTNAVVCTAQDQCHDAGTCNPATGTCSNPLKFEGAACDDGNDCTIADGCHASVCIGTSRPGCPGPGPRLKLSARRRRRRGLSGARRTFPEHALALGP